MPTEQIQITQTDNPFYALLDNKSDALLETIKVQLALLVKKVLYSQPEKESLIEPSFKASIVNGDLSQETVESLCDALSVLGSEVFVHLSLASEYSTQVIKTLCMGIACEEEFQFQKMDDKWNESFEKTSDSQWDAMAAQVRADIGDGDGDVVTEDRVNG